MQEAVKSEIFLCQGGTICKILKVVGMEYWNRKESPAQAMTLGTNTTEIFFVEDWGNASVVGGCHFVWVIIQFQIFSFMQKLSSVYANTWKERISMV